MYLYDLANSLAKRLESQKPAASCCLGYDVDRAGSGRKNGWWTWVFRHWQFVFFSWNFCHDPQCLCQSFHSNNYSLGCGFISKWPSASRIYEKWFITSTTHPTDTLKTVFSDSPDFCIALTRSLSIISISSCVLTCSSRFLARSRPEIDLVPIQFWTSAETIDCPPKVSVIKAVFIFFRAA